MAEAAVGCERSEPPVRPPSRASIRQSSHRKELLRLVALQYYLIFRWNLLVKKMWAFNGLESLLGYCFRLLKNGKVEVWRDVSAVSGLGCEINA